MSIGIQVPSLPVYRNLVKIHAVRILFAEESAKKAEAGEFVCLGFPYERVNLFSLYQRQPYPDYTSASSRTQVPLAPFTAGKVPTVVQRVLPISSKWHRFSTM